MEFGGSDGAAALYTGMQPSDELWRVDRLADYLGTSKHFVYRLTRERRSRFVKVGKELRFTPDDVAAWLEAESVDPKLAVTAPVYAVRRGRPLGPARFREERKRPDSRAQ